MIPPLQAYNLRGRSAAFPCGADVLVADPTLCVRPDNLIPTGYASGDFPCGVIGQARENLAGGVGLCPQADDLADCQTAIADVPNGHRGGCSGYAGGRCTGCACGGNDRRGCGDTRIG